MCVLFVCVYLVVSACCSTFLHELLICINATPSVMHPQTVHIIIRFLIRQTLQRKRNEAPSDVQEDDDLRAEIALAKKRKTKSSEPRPSVKGDLREDLRKSRSTPHQHQIKPSLRSRLGPYAT